MARFKVPFLLLASVVAAAILPAPGEAAGIEVTMNHARIVKLSRAADTIVIGNPNIADASVQDGSTIVITGKGFGVTNLVVLDEQGVAIVDEQIYVSRDSTASVRIYRRGEVQTMSCTPFCESAHKTDAERLSETELNSVQ